MKKIINILKITNNVTNVVAINKMLKANKVELVSFEELENVDYVESERIDNK